jgi:hypothetical protein
MPLPKQVFCCDRLRLLLVHSDDARVPLVLAIVATKPSNDKVDPFVANHYGLVPRLDPLFTFVALPMLSLKDLFGNDLHTVNPPTHHYTPKLSKSQCSFFNAENRLSARRFLFETLRWPVLPLLQGSMMM